jgi:hypothetical protein
MGWNYLKPIRERSNMSLSAGLDGDSVVNFH